MQDCLCISSHRIFNGMKPFQEPALEVSSSKHEVWGGTRYFEDTLIESARIQLVDQAVGRGFIPGKCDLVERRKDSHAAEKLLLEVKNRCFVTTARL
jgi:hypothetical protein